MIRLSPGHIFATIKRKLRKIYEYAEKLEISIYRALTYFPLSADENGENHEKMEVPIYRAHQSRRENQQAYSPPISRE